jgi:hypothetical protein
VAKIRTLKGEFFRNADISRGGPWAKVLAAGLVCAVADDDGRGKADVAYLKGEIFTHDLVALEEVAAALQSLEREHFIRLYSDHKKPFFAVLNWIKHQPVPPSRYKASVLPAPPNTKPRRHSPTERKRLSTPASSRAGVGSEGKGIGIGKHGDEVVHTSNGLTLDAALQAAVVPVDHDVTTVCLWLLNKRQWESFSSLEIAKRERAIAAQMLNLGLECDELIHQLDAMWEQTDADDRPSSLAYFWTRLQDEAHARTKQQAPSHARTGDGLTKVKPEVPASALRHGSGKERGE